MANLSLRPLFFRKTQLWSLGCRCFRQTLFEHESHFSSISSLTLHFGAQHVPSFFFLRFRAAALESQSRSICSDTIWSNGFSLSNGTGLSHIGHVGTCLLFFGAKNLVENQKNPLTREMSSLRLTCRAFMLLVVIMIDTIYFGTALTFYW